MSDLLVNLRFYMEDRTISKEVPLAMTVQELVQSISADKKLNLFKSGLPLDEAASLNSLELDPGCTITVVETQEPAPKASPLQGCQVPHKKPSKPAGAKNSLKQGLKNLVKKHKKEIKAIGAGVLAGTLVYKSAKR